MVQVSDFLFYFVLFKMKKIEISLNPKFNTADEIITQLLRFYTFVRFSVFFIIIGIIFKIASSFYFLFNSVHTGLNEDDSSAGIGSSDTLQVMTYVLISYNILFFILQMYLIYYF